MERPVVLPNSNGFTLIELMIALALVSIITAGIITSFTGQQDAELSQKQVVEMQQNSRAALYILAREIRMAGYDPYGGSSGAGITNAGYGTSSNDPLTFSYVSDDDGVDNATIDTDGDGFMEDDNNVTDEQGELKYVSFYAYDAYGDGDDDLGMKVGAANVNAIAENIVNDLDPDDPVVDRSDADYQETFFFTYLDASGNDLGPDPTISQISAVRVNIVTQVDAGTTDYTSDSAIRTITSIITLRN